MSYSERRFNFYDDLVKKDIYTSKIGATNILFLGGCRSYAYAVYFEEICKYVPYFVHGQCGISAIGVHIIDLLKRQITPNIRNTIENADVIICEQIRHYSFLNTSNSCEQNIFNNFNIKPSCKIIQVPNLEFRYYANEISFENIDDKNDINKVQTIKQENFNKFIEHCNKYNFRDFAEYISTNINDKRLFVTFNHPCNNTLLEVIKEIVKNGFEQELKDPILSILLNIRIFDEHFNTRTIICDSDYECGINRNVT